jgi:hypothetical protein
MPSTAVPILPYVYLLLGQLHTQFEILIKYVAQHFPCIAMPNGLTHLNSDSIFQGLKDFAVKKSPETLG